MRSIAFPNIFSQTYVNMVEDYDASFQNLILLLQSNKGELFGDPYYGTNLKKFLFDQNDIILRDLVADDIYSAIKLFMPQISVDRSDIVIKSDTRGNITASIKAVNKLDFSTDLYNIILLQSEN